MTVFGIRARLNHAPSFERIAKQWRAKLLKLYIYYLLMKTKSVFHRLFTSIPRLTKFAVHHVEFIKNKTAQSIKIHSTWWNKITEMYAHGVRWAFLEFVASSHMRTVDRPIVNGVCGSWFWAKTVPLKAYDMLPPFLFHPPRYLCNLHNPVQFAPPPTAQG